MKKLLLILAFLLQFNALKAHDCSVVCLHGFFRSYKCMLPIANTLKNEGVDVYLWDYPSRKKTIEKHAEGLVEVLQLIAKEKPGQPIHFVTHSLGGIIVRCATNHPDCPQEAKIGKAILLAPPNKGAKLARNLQGCPLIKCLFGKRAGTQLLTFTEAEMADLGPFPQTMEVMVIAGDKCNRFLRPWVKEPSDGKVTVEETRLQTPHTHHTLKVSHSWIMTSRESINLTRDFLLGHDDIRFASCANCSRSNGLAGSAQEPDNALHTSAPHPHSPLNQ